MHIAESGAPQESEKVPAPQLVQVTVPVLAANVPAAQLMQLVAPTVEYVPATQPMHTDEAGPPVLVEYRPTAQSVHTTAPVFPA